MVGSFEGTSLQFLIIVIEYMYARVAQLVEYDLAKVGVAGSSPVFRSKKTLELTSIIFFDALVVELVDTQDLKSCASFGVRVQVPSGVLKNLDKNLIKVF